MTLIGEIDSDRICGIRVRLTYPETKELTILGVYTLPVWMLELTSMYKYSVS